jgi:hypothetical protein
MFDPKTRSAHKKSHQLTIYQESNTAAYLCQQFNYFTLANPPKLAQHK